MEFQYILIAIGVILALLLLYFGFTRFIKNKDLQQPTASTVDCYKLLGALGGQNNVTEVRSSPSKLTVGIKEHDKVQIDLIKELGASGIVEGANQLSMIFGKQSSLIEEDLKKIL